MLWSLKLELGLRPIYNQKEHWVAAHLLISVLAYQAVHAIRTKLRANGERMSWKQIRHTLATMHWLTTVINESDRPKLQVRQNTEPNGEQRRFFKAMELIVNRDQRTGKILREVIMNTDVVR